MQELIFELIGHQVNPMFYECLGLITFFTIATTIILTKLRISMLEHQFITKSSGAFREAAEDAISNNDSIVASENGIIYRVFKGGRKEFIKEIEKPVKVEKRKYIING